MPEVVVDNANPSPAGWAPIIAAAHAHGAEAACRMSASMRRSRSSEPITAAGFDEVQAVRSDGSGGFDVFTHAAGESAYFDSRLWLGNDTADAPRCALNGWCYWALRNHGQTSAQATKTFERPGFDPVRGTEVTATRRRVLVDRDLPMKDEYRDHVRRLL